ncbi:MAG: murein biosynthesis integral rane protein MurJ [Caloramator sp.]|jgi:putative peptidoglycan lipid II flippase|uniref:murein biosynthesis integral membrane protein MurJ n=1 Tax=Caloramator sp. TaxID=1871330 RepID=UPI001DF44922|nr:murein biosynthesis integral membrane protein MurJ [Caloramator sp.]MBZ4663254.1 murein biosynthesis integral rane protein MurJ [Caloramator sp.]
MKKTALIIMIITIFSKFLGFAREVSLSYFFGANNVTDAYLISLTIPGVLFAFIGTAISTGFIPMFSDLKAKEGEEKTIKFTNNIVNILIVLCTILVVITVLFTTPIVKLFATGFSGETLKLAVKFTRISIFGIYFSGLVYIFSAYLQIKNNFVIPALIGFPMNIIIIFSMFVASKTYNIYLSIGSVVAFLAQLLLLLPFVFKKGYKFTFIFNVKDKYIKNLIAIALPAIFGVSVNQLNVLVDRTIASKIAEGGISALNYANKLNGFVMGLFVTSISTVIFPLISKMVAENNYEGLKKSLSESISAINFLVIPSTVGAMVFSTPIVEMLFGRGAFDERAVQMTSSALFFYSIGMIGYGLREVLSKAFYSMKDTKTPTINAVIALIMNIILNITLSKFMGIAGLALATSISAIVCTGLLFISLRKKIGSFGLKEISISFIKITVASIIMGAVAKISYNVLVGVISKNLSLICSIIIGGIVYFVVILFMKIKEVDEIVLKIKQKFLRKVA